ncbi:MAG: homoserine dehydrogenase [bacterium]
MREIGVGLLGFGTVGAGVVECLQRNGALIAERAGVRIALKRIADLDLKSDRGVKVDRGILTKDAGCAIADPSVDIVVELIGGTNIARKFILQALSFGKPVVTANKALLAGHGGEIFGAADKAGVDVCFEASVAGGIPVIRALSRGLVADNIESIHGILNGTCNYILTRMSQEGMSFDVALKEAQAAGYAEADPGLDIDGHDTAHKAAILALLAYGSRISLKSMPVEGIRGIAHEDIAWARDLGYRVKLLAAIRRVDGAVEARVGPALVPADHMIASVGGVFNAVLVKSDVAGVTLYYGRGAGRMPTASAVVSDIVDLARKLATGSNDRVSPFPRGISEARLLDSGETGSRYYLRMLLPDKPGILGRISVTLGRNGISIASVRQTEMKRTAGRVPVVFVTHKAREGQVVAALREIDSMKMVGGRTIRLRIEDFE